MEIHKAEMFPMPVAAVLHLLAERIRDCDTEEKREELVSWLRKLAMAYEPVAKVTPNTIK